MGSFEYLGVDITTDPAQLEAEGQQVVLNQYPGYQFSDTDPFTLLIRAVSQVDALSRDAYAELPQSVFRSAGVYLFGIPPIAASPANFNTTWTLTDTLGHIIPANTQILVDPAAGAPIAYATVADTVVPAGSNTATVYVAATTPGADSNFTASGSSLPTITLLDSLSYVTSIAMISPSSVTNGSDDENDSDYLNRLRASLSTLSETPVNIADYVALSAYYPGVGRALAYDMYNPGNYVPIVVSGTGVIGRYYDPQSGLMVAATGSNSYTAARTVTVFVLNSDGSPLTTGNYSLQTNLATYLNNLRELGFRVYVMSPDITYINVLVTVQAYPTYSLTDVQARVFAALRAYINPLNFGSQAQGGLGSNLQGDWVADPYISIYKLAQVIQDVDGVYRIQAGSLKADKTNTPTGTTDILVLSGGTPVALPLLDPVHTTLASVTVTY